MKLRFAVLAATACMIAVTPGLAIKPADAQSLPDRICAAARSYLSRSPALTGATFLATADLNSRSWARVANPIFASSSINAAANVDFLYIAYMRPTAFDEAGAVALRIAVPVSKSGRPTNRVDIHRPAIARDVNRCEPRGRYPVSTNVRLNQYIDYHNVDRGRPNSALEDFHFAYPSISGNCTRTDQGNARATYNFEDVTRTQGDTIASRFGFVGTAYAVTHQYASLRSELHFRPSAQLGAMCVGFTIALNTKPASVVVHDHGFVPNLPISRYLTIQR
jgi:hypothetical protein